MTTGTVYLLLLASLSTDTATILSLLFWCYNFSSSLKKVYDFSCLKQPIFLLFPDKLSDKGSNYGKSSVIYVCAKIELRDPARKLDLREIALHDNKMREI